MASLILDYVSEVIDEALWLLRRACRSRSLRGFCEDVDDLLVVLADASRGGEWVDIEALRIAGFLARKARGYAYSHCGSCREEKELLLKAGDLLEKAVLALEELG